MTNNTLGDAIKKVHFLGRIDAQDMTAPAAAVIISIHDASEPAAQLQPGWVDRLTLCFHDTDDGGGVQTPFSWQHAQQALQFVLQHSNSAEQLYVHCSMGVSRSAGIALALAGMLQVPCYRDGRQQTAKTWSRLNRRCYEMLQMEALRAGLPI